MSDPTRPTGDDPDATRAVGGDATRAVGGEQDATQVLGQGSPALEASVPVGGGATSGTSYDAIEGEPTGPAEEPGRDRRRDVLIGAGGVVLGLLLAVLVAFLAGGGDDDLDLEGADRVAAVEAERDELAGQVADLEAQLEAADAGADADLEAQRAALDERAAALDARAAALDERETSLEQREAAVAEREATADDGDTGGEGDGNGGGGIDLPDLPDADEVEGFFSQLAERIRSLFG